MPSSPDFTSNYGGSNILRADPAPRRDGPERWYAVYTRVNHEAGARCHLQEQGFKTFFPRYATKVHHARQVKTVLAPLFPRYLFVALDLRRHRWRSVNGTSGVVSLVMQNDIPAPVAKGAVEALLGCCDDGAVMSFPQLRPGQIVRVVAGPFAEHIGILERSTGPERIRVLLAMMHGQVSVEMTRGAVATN